jgi:hypothetical protein
MYRQILFLVSVCLLFTNVSCPEECESLFFGGNSGATLTIELSDATEIHVVNDVLELNAQFSAIIDAPGERTYKISKNGGLIITEVYRINPDTFLLEPALDAFTVEVQAGELLPPPEEDTLNAVVRTRYHCPDQSCSFRQSFRPLTPGAYVIRVAGGPIDEIQANFDYCEAPNLSVTTLVGGGNSGPASTGTYFETPYGRGFWPFYDSLISVEGNPNTYFFTVE